MHLRAALLALGASLVASQDLTTDFEDLDTTAGTSFAGLGLRVGL